MDMVARAVYGRPLQAWQRLVADVAGEYQPDTGDAVWPVVVLHVPRRAGKSALVLARLLRRVLGQPRSQSWYTAQTGGDAGRAFRREWLPAIAAAGLSSRFKISLRAGSESIEYRPHGSALTCFAPIEKALHGTNVDEAVIDEAWAFDTDAGRAVEEAVFPAQLTRPGSQTWIVSAGGTVASTWLDGWLSRAEAGAGGVALFDWGANPDDPSYDPTDPATWWTAHPALGDTVRESDIAAELARSSNVAAFERAFLNVWPRPRDLTQTLIDVERWHGLADVDAPAVAHALAFDVAADRSHAALAAAGIDAGRVVVEVLDYRPGVGWIIDAVRAWLAGHPSGIVVCDALAAGTVADQLAYRGIETTRTGPAQMARACADLVDAVTGAVLAHRGQALLDDVLSSAGRRSLGDGWAWSRRTSDTDISPLVAVTLAAWAARSRPAMPAPFVVAVR